MARKLRITPEQQARRVAMAQARVAVHRMQEAHGLTDAEFLMILAELQSSILGYIVREEHGDMDRSCDG